MTRASAGRSFLSVVPAEGAPPSGSDRDPWFDSWVLSMQAAGWSHRTVTERSTTVRHLGKWCGADPLTLTVDDINRWLARPNLSRNSRSTYFGAVAAMYRWAEKTGRIELSPLAGVARPREKRGLPRPLPPMVVEAALAKATGRTRTYLILALYAGLRAHEIAKIRGEHITKDELFVHGKGDRDDTLPTHPLIWAEAQTYPRKGFWFVSPGRYGHVRGGSITTTVRRLLQSVGYEGTLHAGRHTYGTNVLRAAGGNARVAQELLRHASLTTTALYTKVEDGERRDAIMRLG